MNKIPIAYEDFSGTVKAVLMKKAIKTIKEISAKETDLKNFTPTDTKPVDSKKSFRLFIASL